MTRVTRIEWTYRTPDAGASPDSRVSVEIFRDGQLLAHAHDSADAPARLERGPSATRSWSFDAMPAGPASPEFPSGVRGRLDVRFRVHGDDAWRIGAVESTVTVAEPRPAHGASGRVQWVERRERFVFPGVDVLRADPGEGIALLTLSY